MKIKLTHPAARMPTLGSEGAGAFDCYASIPTFAGGITLYPGETQKIGLGFAAEIPPQHVALLIPRSGTGLKGMHLRNTVGCVDSDFRGELVAAIVNNSDDQMRILDGDRICQMLILPVWVPRLHAVDELSTTVRGAGSFGSTGK